MGHSGTLCLWQQADTQIVTGVEVTMGNCFPDVWEILPEGNISQTEGKQFPIVTDNDSLYLFCYTSQQYGTKNTNTQQTEQSHSKQPMS